MMIQGNMMTEAEIGVAVEHKAQLKNALLKAPNNRSYDDLLLLKQYIKKTEFITKHFAGIANPKQMNDICKSMVLESYQAGEVVFNQGDVGDKVYIILSGKCEVKVQYTIDLLKGKTEVREKVIVTFSDGQFFGERALEFNDVRSATVICTSYSDLVSINKDTYMMILNEARSDQGLTGALSIEQLGTKENVIRTLSKVREKRNNQELEAASSFLQRRIPFFKDYNAHEMIELCRVAETVSIWRRSILFKQGQIGQAFYVILSGTVEVWVHEDNLANKTPNQSTSSGSTMDSAVKYHINKHHQDITDGLGVKVNQLVSGEAFGERALENESSQRMASIVTGDEVTDLLVIAKEDYHNLIGVMQHADNMARLKLLRQTELFRTVDVVHLKVMAHFMQSHKYQIGEYLVKSGEKANEMIIIDTGECRVETEVKQGYDKVSAETLKRIKMDMPYVEPIHHTPAELHRMHVERHQAEEKRKKAAKEELSIQIGNSTPFETGAEVFKAGISKTSDLITRTKKAPINAVHDSDHTNYDAVSVNAAASAAAASLSSRDTASRGEPFKAAEPSHRGRKNPSFLVNKKLARNDSVLLANVQNLGTVSLGRIAPHSVLAAYVTSTNYVNEEVIHPETVVATTLVTTFNMSKHDFFNHMPADTRQALKRLISSYKRPKLHSLWENAPQVLNEDLWRKQKAWEHFKSGLLAKDIYADILQSQKVLTHLHITAHSGNTAEASQGRVERASKSQQKTGLGGKHRTNSGIFSTIEMINQSIESRSKHKPQGLKSTVVDINWGIRTTEPDNFRHAETLARSYGHREPLHGMHGGLKLKEPKPATFSTLIRDRINESHLTSTSIAPFNPTLQKHGGHKHPAQPTSPSSKIATTSSSSSSAAAFEHDKDGDHSAVAAARAEFNPAHKNQEDDDDYNHHLLAASALLNGSTVTGGEGVEDMPAGSSSLEVPSLVQQSTMPASAAAAAPSGVKRGGGGENKTKSIMIAEQHLLNPDGSKLPPLRSKSMGKELSEPFQLVQIHRQSSMVSKTDEEKHADESPTKNEKSNSSDAFSSSKRTVQCYFRLCGSTATNALAKERADVIMENIYLTLFKGAAEKEKELVLVWMPFKGFDSMPLDASDHFLIYCRTTPVEYAFITPSKNLMMEAFPVSAMMNNHKFACIVVNRMGDCVSGGGGSTMKKENEAAAAAAASKAVTLAKMSPKKRAAHQRKLKAAAARAAAAAGNGDDDNSDSNTDEEEDSGEAAVDAATVAAAVAASKERTSSNSAMLVKADSTVGNSSELTPAPVTRSVTLPPKSGALLSGQRKSNAGIAPPAYRLEFSLLTEVLAVFPTRFDAVKYSVSKFGATSFEAAVGFASGTSNATNINTFTSNGSNTSNLAGTTTTRPGDAIAMTNIVAPSDVDALVGPSGEDPTRIYVRRSAAPGSGTNTRVLDSLNSGLRLVCIVPLFSWIEINDDTMNMLDFTRSFDHSLLDAVGALDGDVATEDDPSQSGLRTGTYPSFGHVPIIRFRGSMEERSLEKTRRAKNATIGVFGAPAPPAPTSAPGAKSAEGIKLEKELILSFADAGLIDRKYIKKQEKVIRTAAHSRVSNKRLAEIQENNNAKMMTVLSSAQRTAENTASSRAKKEQSIVHSASLTLLQESVKSKELNSKVTHHADLVAAASASEANMFSYGDYPMTAGGNNIRLTTAAAAAAIGAGNTAINVTNASTGSYNNQSNALGSTPSKAARNGPATTATTSNSAPGTASVSPKMMIGRLSRRNSNVSMNTAMSKASEGGSASSAHEESSTALFDLAPPSGVWVAADGTRSGTAANGVDVSTRGGGEGEGGPEQGDSGASLFHEGNNLLVQSASQLWTAAMSESAVGRVTTAAREVQMESDEARIRKLQASLKERAKLIMINDALCENEHKSFERSNKSKANVGSNFDSSKILDSTLAPRMNFFETLNTGTVGLRGSKSTNSLKFGVTGGNNNSLGGNSHDVSVSAQYSSNNNNSSTSPQRTKKNTSTAGAGNRNGGLGASSSTSALLNKIGLLHDNL